MWEELSHSDTDNNAQEAIDNLIDRLAEEGHCAVIEVAEAEKNHYEDEYVVGGNEGLALVHYGSLRIIPVMLRNG